MKLSRKGAFLVAQLESACSAGDLGLILGSGRSPGEGNGNPLQYACLENPIDRGAWKTTVKGVTRVGHDLVTKPPPPSSKDIKVQRMAFVMEDSWETGRKSPQGSASNRPNFLERSRKDVIYFCKHITYP